MKLASRCIPRFVLSVFATLMLLATAASSQVQADEQWVTYDGFEGPGKGKHIVLISGDEEYRSEEGLPQLGKILAKHHGFKCTVLFALDADGTINPNNGKNIPGLEALDSADLMIILTRFRNLPDEQMKHIDDFLRAGKPVIGMRTSTHAFNVPKGKTYSHYGNGYGGDKEEWRDGFGRLVLGEKWISHHGGHKRESTRGVIVEEMKDHPILRGCGDIWGDTDVYGVRLPLPGDSQPLVLGQVLQGMSPTDPPVEGKKNDPMMPVAWIKSYSIDGGKQGQVMNTTMGSSTDLKSESLRRLIVNSCYWALGMQEKIDGQANVAIVGDYQPSMYGFGGFKKGVKPADHKL